MLFSLHHLRARLIHIESARYFQAWHVNKESRQAR